MTRFSVLTPFIVRVREKQLSSSLQETPTGNSIVQGRQRVRESSRGPAAASALALPLLTGVLIGGLVLGLDGCGGGEGVDAPVASSPSAAAAITSDQKLRLERLSSVFENGTVTFDYGYAENIGDGRGITCGRVGFTTGTGDWYQVVQAYTALEPTNPLAPYLPRLAALAASSTPNPDTTGLGGLIAATAAAAGDPVMQRVQDAYVDSLIYDPAVQIAADVGVHSALAVADLYDAVLTHGVGGGPDDISAIVAAATQAAGGTPKSGVGERAWLTAFDNARRYVMLHPTYAPSAAAWAAAVDRIDVYDRLIADGNWDLHGPINTLSYGVSVP